MVGLSILLLLLRNFAGIYAGEWDTGAAPIDSYTTETKFGYSVAISDSFAIVGATDVKKAFIFAYDPLSGAWGTTAAATIDSYTTETNFGYSVAMSDSFAIVGAPSMKKAFIFAYNPLSGSWGTTAAATIDYSTINFPSASFFGNCVAMTDSYTIVGAMNSNKAFIFTYDSSLGAWDTTPIAIIDGYSGLFGQSVAMTDSYAIIGALSSQIAYIFAYDSSSGAWGTTAAATIDGYTTETLFGESVAISDGFALVGSVDNTAFIFAYDSSSGTWDTTAAVNVDYRTLNSIAITDSYAYVDGRIYSFDPGSGTWGTIAVANIEGDYSSAGMSSANVILGNPSASTVSIYRLLDSPTGQPTGVPSGQPTSIPSGEPTTPCKTDDDKKGLETLLDEYGAVAVGGVVAVIALSLCFNLYSLCYYCRKPKPNKVSSALDTRNLTRVTPEDTNTAAGKFPKRVNRSGDKENVLAY